MAQVFEFFAFALAAGESDGGVAHCGGELEGGDADAAAGAGDEDYLRGGTDGGAEISPESQGLMCGEIDETAPAACWSVQPGGNGGEGLDGDGDFLGEGAGAIDANFAAEDEEDAVAVADFELLVTPGPREMIVPEMHRRRGCAAWRGGRDIGLRRDSGRRDSGRPVRRIRALRRGRGGDRGLP